MSEIFWEAFYWSLEIIVGMLGLIAPLLLIAFAIHVLFLIGMVIRVAFRISKEKPNDS